MLLTVTPTVSVTTYNDVNLVAGQFYYYTIWVHDSTNDVWRRAGNQTVLMTKNYGYSDLLYSLVPEFYRVMDYQGDSPGPGLSGGQLQAFLSIIGFQCDHIRTEYDSLLTVNNPDKCAEGVLPLIANELGWPYEAELGGRLMRKQLRNAVHLYKIRGTVPGLTGLISAMTGWQSSIAMSGSTVNITITADRVNLVTNPSFEVDTAGWTGMTRSTAQHYSGAAASGSATGTASIPVTVTPGQPYMLSTYVYGPTGSWAINGVSTAGVPANTWTRINALVTPGATPLTLSLTGPAGTRYYDAVLAEAGTQLLAYFDGSVATPQNENLWSGTAHASTSHHFNRRQFKNSRLALRVLDFIPAGLTKAIYGPAGVFWG